MKSINIKSLDQNLAQTLHRLRPYTGVILFMLFAFVYGFLVLRINSLSGAPVDQAAVDAQVKASPTLRIDTNAVQQLQTLKDNSVNVQTLFTDNRTNPFQE
jgi:hypothetical protein